MNNKLLKVSISGNSISVVTVNTLVKIVNFDSENLTANSGATVYCSATDLGYSAPIWYTLAVTLSVRTNNDNFFFILDSFILQAMS